MSLLDHITNTVCPTCGSEVRLEFEERDNFATKCFDCGFDLIYFVKTNAVEGAFICNNSKEYKEMIKKRVIAEEAIRAFIDYLDVDDDYKDNVKYKGLS